MVGVRSFVIMKNHFESQFGYLVAERLGGDDGDLLDDPLVGVEVEGQLGVVLLDDDASCLLDSLGSDTAHL